MDVESKRVVEENLSSSINRDLLFIMVSGLLVAVGLVTVSIFLVALVA